MSNKKLSRLLEPNLKFYFFFMLLFVVVAVPVNWKLALAEAAVTVLLYFYFRQNNQKRRQSVLQYIDSVTGSVDITIDKGVLPDPTVTVDVTNNYAAAYSVDLRAVLDAILAQDPYGRVACETTASTGLVHIMGEITTSCYVDIPKIARQVVLDIGYDRSQYGFDGNTCAVITNIDEQSGDIAMGVDKCLEVKESGASDLDNGAGDQGMMFGYACDETPELMPLAISIAQKMAKRLTDVRKQGLVDYLRPDGKTQVTVRYEEGKPVEVTTIVISTQHAAEIEDMGKIKADLIEHVITPVMAAENMPWENADIYVNPTGRFVVGGPMGDTGLTGRKIIVDTYGGYGRHGGGAFSGKDCTKVDRSAAYAARWVAKNVVAAGLADRCEVELAYAIGVSKPLSIMVDTFGTAHVAEDKIVEAVEKTFDLRPGAIIRDLDLRRPIYEKTAAYGHFGREDADFTWEKTDRVEELKAACGL